MPTEGAVKLGNSIFGDEFVMLSFSLQKAQPMGYTPVGGLLALSAGNCGLPDCALTECDPDADRNDPCERLCFADAVTCQRRCGTCEDTYCDCANTDGNPTSGYYEDFLSTPGAYNFGETDGQCWTPGPSALDAGSIRPDCNCTRCPSASNDPDPNADPTVCCGEKNSKEFCVNSQGQKCPATTENGNIEGGHIWKPYVDTRPLPGGGFGPVTCYLCGCPDGYTSKKPTQFKCTIGTSPACEQCGQNEDCPYSTPEECQSAIDTGECADRWKCKETESGCEQTTDWKAQFKSETECNNSDECAKKYYYCKWNRYGYKFECKETLNQTWENGAEWYNDIGACQAAIDGNSGNCSTGWSCRPGTNIGISTGCRKAPSNFVAGQGAEGAGSVVWATESECKTACCSGSEYGEALGRCVWIEYSGGVFGTRQWRCGVMTRNQCSAKPSVCAGGFGTCPPEFSCCGGGTDFLGYEGCSCSGLGDGGCPGGDPACGDGFMGWTASVPGVFGGGVIQSCECKQAPAQQPV